MTPTTYIPGRICQAAQNASSRAKAAAVAIDRSATYAAMRKAEIDLRHASDEIQAALDGLQAIMNDAVREIAA